VTERYPFGIARTFFGAFRVTFRVTFRAAFRATFFAGFLVAFFVGFRATFLADFLAMVSPFWRRRGPPRAAPGRKVAGSVIRPGGMACHVAVGDSL
jgi:hypothetical protein